MKNLLNSVRKLGKKTKRSFFLFFDKKSPKSLVKKIIKKNHKYLIEK